MRIVIDLQGAQTGSRFRGIGRYSLSLAKALVRNRGDHEIIIALSGLFPNTIESIRAEFDGLLPQNNIRIWEAPGPVCEINPANTWRRRVSELIREGFLKSLNPDFVLVTSLFEGYGDEFVASVMELDNTTPTAAIFYDLIPLIYREIYLADKHVASWYNNKVEQCKKIDLLLSISESSRQEAIEYLGIPKNRIVNISTASDERFKPISIPGMQKEFRSRFGLTKPFIMYSSATDWRKNHLRLIDAYSKLPPEIRAHHQLAFVGGMPPDHRDNFERHAKECGLAKNELVITGSVTDEEMNVLYNLCKAFIFPSWHEGFGLPALEAMQCGRAVIGANRSSIPEVIGRHDALFDPFDELSISKKIEQILTNDDFRSVLEKHGLQQSKKFSWDISAKQAINAIENYKNSQVSSKNNIKISTESETLISFLIEKISCLQLPYDECDLLDSARAISQNHPDRQKPQLLIDVSELIKRDAKTGIQRVVRSILWEWLIHPPDDMQVEPVYALNNQCYRYARLFTRRFLSQTEDGQRDEPVEFCSGDVFFGLDLLHPDLIVGHQNFYKHLRSHNVLVKFMVYDLLPLQLPQYSNDGVSAGHRKWLEVVRQSDGVICISKAVADEVSTWANEHCSVSLRPFKISWFHLGADIANSAPSYGLPDGADTVLEVICKNPSFLMVGTIEPRKGHAQILAAFEQLWAEGVEANLVIVGQLGWKVEALTEKLRKHSDLGTRLFWLENISDEYLERVYAASTCLISASEGEGFGLPLIEAAQHKKPIIARDLPVFQEVAGEHAYYFSGKDPHDLANAVKKWLALFEDAQHPKSDEMPWLTWRQSAAHLMDVILQDQRYIKLKQCRHDHEDSANGECVPI